MPALSGEAGVEGEPELVGIHLSADQHQPVAVARLLGRFQTETLAHQVENKAPAGVRYGQEALGAEQARRTPAVEEALEARKREGAFAGVIDSDEARLIHDM